MASPKARTDHQSKRRGRASRRFDQIHWIVFAQREAYLVGKFRERKIYPRLDSLLFVDGLRDKETTLLSEAVHHDVFEGVFIRRWLGVPCRHVLHRLVVTEVFTTEEQRGVDFVFAISAR